MGDGEGKWIWHANRDILQFSNCHGRARFIFAQGGVNQVTDDGDANHSGDYPSDGACGDFDAVPAADPVGP